MEDKDLVKQKTDIVELIGQYVKLTKAGSNYKGLCPFHQEKTPSFFVHPEMGYYKCFGCGSSGDIFTWLMEMDSLTFPEALQELAKRAGVQLAQFKADSQTKTRQQTLEALSLTKEFYHWLLTKHPAGRRALQYTGERGISELSITTFCLGYSPPDWDGLTQYLTTQKKIPLSILIQAGLSIPKKSGQGAYDRFRGRLMFPLQNPRSQTLGFSGRVIPGLTPGEDKTGKYINSPETELYHKRELLFGLEITKSDIKKNNQAIIVEGELDVISSWQAGVTNIVAIKGSALTEEQIKILKRYAQTLTLALDTDIAGDQAARRGIRAAQDADLEVTTIRLHDGKDPDEVARKDPRVWKQAVSNAVDIYQFFLDSAFQRFDSGTAAGKQKISVELLPILAEIPGSVIQSYWISQLATRLDLKEEILLQEMRRLPNRGNTSWHASTPSRQTISESPLKPSTSKPYLSAVTSARTDSLNPHARRSRLEQLLLAHYLQTDINSLLQPEISELFTLPWIQRLISHLNGLDPKPTTPLVGRKAAGRQSGSGNTVIRLPPELESLVAETLLFAEQNSDQSLKINYIINNLKQINIKGRMKQLRQRIIKLEPQGKDAGLAKAQKQFSILTSQLAKLKD
jgi:DNA primase